MDERYAIVTWLDLEREREREREREGLIAHV
jgi:hypothetical protein